MNKTSNIRKILWALAFLFAAMNIIAIFHAYKFTHFSDRKKVKTEDPGKLSVSGKVSTILFGISNPRPVSDDVPAVPYETILLNGNNKTACWYIKAPHPKGTVILFHGFSGQKSSMLDKAAVFRAKGFNTLLVDFMGSGGSEGNQTTIGFFEAEQVKTCYDFIAGKGEQPIFLFGTSMGAVAIMKAIGDFDIHPQGIMIECPFGSMYQTVCARFRTMNVPTFPMAGLLVFWGGIQNGFWAFGHNPAAYAKTISCPTLLLYGQLDEKVSRAETDEIYANLRGPKTLVVYEQAGHENYLNKYREEWAMDVSTFILPR